LIEISEDWKMKKVAASVLSLAVIGTWWSVERPHPKSPVVAASGSGQQAIEPDPFENEDSTTFAATPSTLARSANISTTTQSKPVTTAPKSAKRLKIQVEVNSPKDLKVKEGQHIAINDTVAVQLSKLLQSLTEARLKVSEAMAIEDAARMTRSNKVDEVRVEITTAQRDLDLAHAKLAAAIEKTNQARADRQVAEAEREDRVFRTELERIKLTEIANLQKHDREYEIAQLQVKKTQLIAQIRELKGVTAPFDGTVKRVKLLAQQGNVLRYEVGLMYVSLAA
jgi:hypothetical protein